MITVACWLWRQSRATTVYSTKHVNLWAKMISAHLDMPHEIACITDMPAGLDPSIRVITPPPIDQITLDNWREDHAFPQCLRRISVFQRDAKEWLGTDRLVVMDIDVTVIRNLDQLFDRPEPLVLMRRTIPNRPMQYAGGMLMLEVGSHPHVWETLTPEAANEASRRFIGSDQSWLSYSLGLDLPTWGMEDGIYVYRPDIKRRLLGNRCRPFTNMRMMFSAGSRKPWNDVPMLRWWNDPWREIAWGRT